MKRILYDFCPKCNGLMKDGICMACGYEQTSEPRYADVSQNAGIPDDPTAPGNTAGLLDGMQKSGGLSDSGILDDQISGNRTLADLQTPKKKKHTGFVVGICVGAVIFVLVLSLAISLILNDVKKNSGKTWNPLQGFGAKENPAAEDEYEGYVPDPTDEYYVEIVDALRDDLSYQVEWQEYKVESEDGAASYYALFPVLAGEFPNMDKMNQAIEAAARQEEVFCQYAAEDEEIASCDIYKEGYVTYMDEDVVSIAFLETIYLNGSGLPKISDINIDVKAGSVLEHRNMVDYSDALAQRVRSQNLYQNSVDIESIPWSDEDIVAFLQGEDGVVFYTPVGLEVGFNYSGSDSGYGWLTVTLKDYAQYEKKW